MLGQGAGWPGKRGAALLGGGVLSRLLCSRRPFRRAYGSMVGSPDRNRSASHLRASEMLIRREQRLLPLPSRGTSRAMEPSMSSSKR